MSQAIKEMFAALERGGWLGRGTHCSPWIPDRHEQSLRQMLVLKYHGTLTQERRAIHRKLIAEWGRDEPNIIAQLLSDNERLHYELDMSRSTNQAATRRHLEALADVQWLERHCGVQLVRVGKRRRVIPVQAAGT